jgi:hypothetical protein
MGKGATVTSPFQIQERGVGEANSHGRMAARLYRESEEVHKVSGTANQKRAFAHVV